MELKNLAQSKIFHGVIFGIVLAIVALLIFRAGVFVGYRRAAFSYRFGENYYRTFDDGRRGQAPAFLRGDLPGGHGAIGKVVRVTLPTFVVAGRDNIEKIVLIKEDTIVRRFRETIKATDLKVGDSVVVLGEPNDEAQVEAKLIRILPARDNEKI